MRIFTPPCTLSNATTLFQQQLICGTKFPFPQVNVVSYKCLRIRVALEHTTTLLPGGGGKGGRGIARMLGKMVWDCDIFSTVLSKIVANSKNNRNIKANNVNLISMARSSTFVSKQHTKVCFCALDRSYIAFNVLYVVRHPLENTGTFP